jgi:hypothetical protein
MFRAWAVLLAAAVCAVLGAAGCHGPASAAVPRPHPNQPPAVPAVSLR